MKKQSLMLLVSLVALSASAQSVLKNGNFSNGRPWPWMLGAKKAPAEAQVADGVCHISISEAGSVNSHRILFQKNLRVHI